MMDCYLYQEPYRFNYWCVEFDCVEVNEQWEMYNWCVNSFGPASESFETDGSSKLSNAQARWREYITMGHIEFRDKQDATFFMLRWS